MIWYDCVMNRNTDNLGAVTTIQRFVYWSLVLTMFIKVQLIDSVDYLDHKISLNLYNA